MKQIEFLIDASHHGQRLDILMTTMNLNLTRSQAKNFIAQGHVYIDEQVATKPGQTVKTGQKITIHLPDPKKLDLIPHDIDFEIRFEDEHLAVLDKPSGLSVHPSSTEQEPTLVHGLLHKLKQLSSVGGVERPGIVHRIDKGTSGILVISKTDFAHQHLSHQFKEHSIDRRYQALVYGDLSKKALTGRIETFFGRHPKDRKKMTGRLSHGRKAVTHWKVQKTLSIPLYNDALMKTRKSQHQNYFTLVECKLETGRTHQIRVHLSELGFPIVGDPVYGDHTRRVRDLAEKLKLRQKAQQAEKLIQKLYQLDHQLLHAYFLKFQHPSTRQELVFESSLPLDFQEILNLLEKSSAPLDGYP